MCSSSKEQVAVEFGFDKAVVQVALSKQTFANAGDLIDYLDLHEEELKEESVKLHEEELKEAKEKEESDKQVILEDLRRETATLLFLRQCRACMKEECSYLALPCSHLCLCSRCAKTCQYCPHPECNLPIDIVLHTFLV